MYSQRQTFDSHLLPELNCKGRYVQYPATSISGGGGATSIYFNNIQALSTKNFMKDFMITYKISIEATPANGKYFKFIKDINNAMRTLVTVNGQISYESDGSAITPIYKTYSERYKSVDNLYYNDIYTYEPDGTNWILNTTDRGVLAGTTTKDTFDVYTSVPIFNELLINGLGGVRGLNIRIILDNNLFSLVDTTLSTSWTATISEATITYTEYETQSDSFYIRIPHFETYNKVSTTNTEVASDTRNTASSPSRVFVHLSVNGQVVSSQLSGNISHPITPSTVGIDINNNVNCWNVSDVYQMYGRCVSDKDGYKGTIQDFTQINMKGVNERGAVLMIDNHNLPVNISTSDIYRFNARVKATWSTITNIYLYTVYMYNAVLVLTPEKSEIKYISDDTFTSEIIEHEDYEDLIVGGFSFSNMFGKIKNFIKKHPPSQILDTVGKVADVVNPSGSKFQEGIGKAQQISNILGMGSTSLF